MLYTLLTRHPEYINEIENNGVDNLKRESIDAIMDILTSAFIMYGLEDEERPNNYGLEIEDLVDIVNDAD
ncbi:hypothetical protein QJV38_01015 [Listeria cossartiae subsp. cayugensis]|uniref:Uncharacterized protein n=2 Tax=Listeria TaxID=1637 RepID=A0ABU2IM63_9LIST|nr:hypothetical protein [Listeria cossartiae]UHP10585.1 hypothetical protein LAX80_002015 [Listeria marthii]MDT0065785.1 hypothetical protein [Listeria cossartiae subsp. cayugensis]MDT0081447.1 hypothetical protein [Listeria cossartiae subsp. cayugensis]MDT0098063.1 hypothetical protein [Listeria cossartiae subsp. cayugensis]MDT0113777.1 hypothetical protein [Listeria cossartiae subsp. cayugensis]